jgi:CDP-diacylglycerol--inositol 3-phosphatidyltransferase
MNEIFFIALYLLSFSSPYLSPTLFSDSKNPSSLQPGSPAAPEPSMFFASPFSAAAMEMARANKMDSTVPWIFMVVSLPFMLIKQWINGVQMKTASQWLAEGDREERRLAGLPRKDGPKKSQ